MKIQSFQTNFLHLQPQVQFLAIEQVSVSFRWLCFDFGWPQVQSSSVTTPERFGESITNI